MTPPEMNENPIAFPQQYPLWAVVADSVRKGWLAESEDAAMFRARLVNPDNAHSPEPVVAWGYDGERATALPILGNSGKQDTWMIYGSTYAETVEAAVAYWESGR